MAKRATVQQGQHHHHHWSTKAQQPGGCRLLTTVSGRNRQPTRNLPRRHGLDMGYWAGAGRRRGEEFRGRETERERATVPSAPKLPALHTIHSALGATTSSAILQSQCGQHTKSVCAPQQTARQLESSQLTTAASPPPWPASHNVQCTTAASTPKRFARHSGQCTKAASANSETAPVPQQPPRHSAHRATAASAPPLPARNCCQSSKVANALPCKGGVGRPCIALCQQVRLNLLLCCAAVRAEQHYESDPPTI